MNKYISAAKSPIIVTTLAIISAGVLYVLINRMSLFVLSMYTTDGSNITPLVFVCMLCWFIVYYLKLYEGI